ncbi:MAG TPA: septal ring lytic transglycosylase RlpA family protein [Solirubrobacteraceae bacterium]|nr:septal ring lytic transglycosylase RlpA family protein [Solirubrobacteraceae bacterium]
MLRRAHAHPFPSRRGLRGALIAAATGLLLVPAASLAATGGGGTSSQTTTTAPVHRANRTETVSGDGITVHAVQSGVLTWRTKFFGTTPSRDAGKIIEIERTAKPGSTTWMVATKTTVASGGTFATSWRANKAGKLAFRAIILRSSTTASAAAASPSLHITVFRLSRASWYGPGFFGHRTACGQILRKTTLGVANRSLKCGTKVSILYHGHSIRVPVIDRGPYTKGVYWDLTEATAQALGMTETERVGTLFPA